MRMGSPERPAPGAFPPAANPPSALWQSCAPTKASATPEVIVDRVPSEHHWTRDLAVAPDGHHLLYSVGSGSNVGGGTMPSPEHPFSLYQDEFDGAYDQGTLFVLTLHPHVTGHRAPMRQLERLIKYMKAKPDVWFATGEQIARWVKDPAHTK